ncbi:UNVERIFIED_CONTAM: hypothetical protein K2H54_001508 [Gekko kuhli]
MAGEKRALRENPHHTEKNLSVLLAGNECAHEHPKHLLETKIFTLPFIVLQFSQVVSFYWALLATIYTLQAEDSVLMCFALTSFGEDLQHKVGEGRWEDGQLDQKGGGAITDNERAISSCASARGFHHPLETW